MGELDHGPVRFDAGDASPAVALLRTHSTSADDMTAWIDIRPLDVPAGVDVADYGGRIHGM
jgi:hypothetical protein